MNSSYLAQNNSYFSNACNYPNKVSPNVKRNITFIVIKKYIACRENIKLLKCPNSVVCRMNGYAYGEVLRETSAGTGMIWLDDIDCTGFETTLTNCSHGGWGNHNCGHGEDVSVHCYSKEPVGSGNLSLWDHALG